MVQLTLKGSVLNFYISGHEPLREKGVKAKPLSPQTLYVIASQHAVDQYNWNTHGITHDIPGITQVKITQCVITLFKTTQVNITQGTLCKVT